MTLEEEEDPVVDLEVDITLTSADKKDFTVKKKHAWISQLVKTTLEQDAEATTMAVPGVNAKELAKIVEYMKHHDGTEPAIIPSPLKSADMKVV